MMDKNQKLLAAKNSIRQVKDYPKKGIVFQDITTLLRDDAHLKSVSDEICDFYADKNITKVVGMESRGFIFGAILAYRLNVGFIPIRKPGKLPYGVYSEKYVLEYGFDELQIHKDALDGGDVVLLHDDLLATGGTAAASLKLIENFNVEKIYVNFMVELSFLNGRKKINSKYPVHSLFQLD